MKDYNKLKQKALKLRKQGLSYNEIKKEVDVAKSTLSLWLKIVRLSEKHRRRLYTKQIIYLSRGAQSQKERRAREVDEIIKKAEQEISLPISTETYRLMGAALYWAEGSKTKMFELTNSDPHLILFVVRWIEFVFKVKSKDLKATLNIYPQQSEIDIKKFWSNLTGIPLQNFRKSYVKPLSKGYKKNNLYYGTIKIMMPRSVDMRYRIFGWTKAVLRDIDPKIKITQRKWQSLREKERPINLS